MIIMVVDPLLDPERNQKPLGAIALVGVAGRARIRLHHGRASRHWHSRAWCRLTASAIFFHVLVIAITAVAILSSYEYMAVQRIRAGEYYGLILFGTVGMCLMSSAMELVLIFIALEISSIATYVLAGFRRRDAASSESSLKYFLLGSFATAFFLYGVAMMFGATGSTNIAVIREALLAGHSGLLAYVAVALMFVGLGFKVAAAPFHIWTPDVYEGAPAPVVGLHVDRPQGSGLRRPAACSGRNPRSRAGSGCSGLRRRFP